MTRQNIYEECLTTLKNNNCIILELPTGFGKTALSIKLVNHFVTTKYKKKQTSMLLLVAKTVHKQTWKDEINKWGGLNITNLTIECYESLKKHEGESFDFIVMDEVHHVNSDTRLELLSTLSFSIFIGLSATIPQKLKKYLKYNYHAQIVSCDITEAIEDEVLPEPEILLYPLYLDRIKLSETIEINSSAKGEIFKGTMSDLWKVRKQKKHAILACTQKQKLSYFNDIILKEKNYYIRSRQEYLKNRWFFDCGERLKYLAYLKNDIVNKILKKLSRQRTITFCKTIEQAEQLGRYCIHSKNKDADEVYNQFNNKEIKHITAVNILNENANLVDCKYAIFANLSSSEVVIPQRLGRAMRHKHPVIIVPYYTATRDEEIVEKMFENYNKDFIRTIQSIDEI